MTTWHESNTGNDQGLIIDDETGRNVAVSYEAKDAKLIAAAPELLEALKAIEGMCNMPEVRKAMIKHEQAYYHKIMRQVAESISHTEN